MIPPPDPSPPVKEGAAAEGSYIVWDWDNAPVRLEADSHEAAAQKYVTRRSVATVSRGVRVVRAAQVDGSHGILCYRFIVVSTGDREDRS